MRCKKVKISFKRKWGGGYDVAKSVLKTKSMSIIQMDMLPTSSPRLLGDVSTKWSFDSLQKHNEIGWASYVRAKSKRKRYQYLSRDGSLLNISFGTVSVASVTMSWQNDCRDCKWRSTSSAVIKASTAALFIEVGSVAVAAFFCDVFLRFGGFALLLCDAFIVSAFRLRKQTYLLYKAHIYVDLTYFLTFSTRPLSSSEDSVASLSDDDTSGFSYSNKRSNKYDRSRITFKRRLWLERNASWKYSFS